MTEKEEERSVGPDVRRWITNLESPNPRMRSQAATELGKAHALEAVPVLITALQEDVNTYVRSAAAESLGHLGDEEAIFPLMDALRDSSSFVRRAAAIALGQLRAKEAQMALLHALEDSNFYVRRAAINAVGKLGIRDLARVLLPLLQTEDARIRRTTITALRRLGAVEAIPELIAMLESYMASPTPRDLPVVKTLVIALGDLAAPTAVPVLMRVLRGYVGARSLAAKALGDIGDPRACVALVEVLEDRSASLRLAALKSLGGLRCVEMVATVRAFLSDPDPRIRRTAALTLGEMQDLEASAPLVEMALSDPSPLARPAAIEGLALLGDASVLPRILPLAEDTNAYLRASLAQALVHLGDGAYVVRETLETLAQDRVAHVAAAAERSLELLEERPGTQAPREVRSVPEPEEQQASEEEGSWFRRLLGFGN